MSEQTNVQWEYKTLKYSGPGMKAFASSAKDPEAKLNKLGAEGWELVDILTAAGTAKHFIFKRPVPESEEHPSGGWF